MGRMENVLGVTKSDAYTAHVTVEMGAGSQISVALLPPVLPTFLPQC